MMHWYCWAGLAAFAVLILIALGQDGGQDPMGGP